MPYTPAQHRLFEAAAHDPAVAKRTGIPQQQASKMAHEGVKHTGSPAAHQKLAHALMGK